MRHYTSTLQEIAANGYLDPYSRQPFFYQLRGNDFKLYSTGIDEDDDGGRHNPESTVIHRNSSKKLTVPDGDIVIWPARSQKADHR